MSFSKIERSVTASDGANNWLSIWGRRHGREPVLLFLPAMGTRASYYRPFAETLAEAGLTVATADLRGHGRSDQRARRGDDHGYLTALKFEIPALLDALEEELGPGPVVLAGHSLGGHFGLLYSALYPGSPPLGSPVVGLVHVAVGSPHYRGFGGRHALRVGIGTQAAFALSQVLAYFPGDKVGFAHQEARQTIDDWASMARNGRYRVAGADEAPDGALARLTLPLLSICIEGDALAPKDAVEEVLSKLKRSALTRVNVGGPALSPRAQHHHRWVLESAPVVAEIKDWLALQSF